MYYFLINYKFITHWFEYVLQLSIVFLFWHFINATAYNLSRQLILLG